MRVIFTKLARQELEDAVRFYELVACRTWTQTQGRSKEGCSPNCRVPGGLVHSPWQCKKMSAAQIPIQAALRHR